MCVCVCVCVCVCTCVCVRVCVCVCCNVVEAHGYGFRSTVVSGEHSRSKTSAIIAIYIALVLLRECSPSLLLMCVLS